MTSLAKLLQYFLRGESMKVTNPSIIGKTFEVQDSRNVRCFTTYHSSRFNYHVTKHGKLNVLLTTRW